MFAKFQKLKTRDEQASSEELAEHAVSVMSTLDEGIRSIDNMDNFHLFLTQIGQSHCKIEGFQKEFFWVSPPSCKSYMFVCSTILLFADIVKKKGNQEFCQK